ncbi:MAG TPA: hypothetical protein PKC19_01175, partial [Roseiflexaceae bacterium]|nr:hypothetical protein [Roseiflexaceae bacterium]
MIQQKLSHPYRLLATALILGGLADLLFNGRALGISVPLFVALGLAAMLWHAHTEGRQIGGSALAAGGAALLFAGLLAVRADALLTTLNLLALLGLLLLLVTAAHQSLPNRLSALLGRMAAALGAIAGTPLPLALAGMRTVPLERLHLAGAAPIGRGLLISIPITATFTILLAGADAIFAGYVT